VDLPGQGIPSCLGGSSYCSPPLGRGTAIAQLDPLSTSSLPNGARFAGRAACPKLTRAPTMQGRTDVSEPGREKCRGQRERRAPIAAAPFDPLLVEAFHPPR
jgi:hypothetical protein